MSGYPPAGGYPQPPPYAAVAPGAGYPMGAAPPPGSVPGYPAGMAPPSYPGAYPAAAGYVPGQPQTFPAGAVPGQDRPPREQCYFIQSRLNNYVLEVDGASFNPGTRVVMAAQKGQGEDSQLWFDDHTGTIKSRLNLLCLDTQDYGQGFNLVKSQGPPPDALCLGHQTDGAGDLYCGVAHSQFGNIPAKAKGNDCWFAYNDVEHPLTHDFSWVISPVASLQRNTGGTPPGAMAVGFQNNGSGVHYAAIARSKWGTIPGKAKDGTCWYGIARKEYYTQDFDWVVAAGSLMVLNPYVYCKPGQLWVRATDKIQSRQEVGKVLQVTGNPAGRSTVTSSMTTGDIKQLWSFPSPGMSYAPPNPVPVMPVPPAYTSQRYFFLRSEMHGKVIDIEGGNRSPGAMVIVWPRKSPPSDNQLWYMDEQGTIRSKLTTFALEPSGHGIWVQPFNGSGTQTWTVHGNKIVNKSRPGVCLDIKGGAGNDGVKIVQGKYKGGPNQHWVADYI